MPTPQDSASLAVFCDFENLALGVRDANYARLDIRLVLERLLLKGSIVVKKAYCNWERYREFKEGMHEANFELIEIPHVRQSGKNSADIRLVVDALDLCYTKSHVDTFVIISGDSDFSPLVSKLRENAKRVIGVGVKRATSDLLVANCDEFIFYDDLERERRRAAEARLPAILPPVAATPAAVAPTLDEAEKRKQQALEITVQTFDALTTEEGDSQRIWASTLKSAIKRRKPDFSESYHGFKAFGQLLEEAQARGLLTLGRDERSGTYVSRAAAPDLLVHAEGRKPRGARPAEQGQPGRRRGAGGRGRRTEAKAPAGALDSRIASDAAVAGDGADASRVAAPAAQTASAPGFSDAAMGNGRDGATQEAPGADTRPTPGTVSGGGRQSRTRRSGGASSRANAENVENAGREAGQASPAGAQPQAAAPPTSGGIEQVAARPPVPRTPTPPAASEARPSEAAEAPAKPARKSARKAPARKAATADTAATPAKAVKRTRAAKKAKPAEES